MDVLAAFADRSPVPWANGAGETTELMSFADSAELTPGHSPWRLSIARLERAGPFSALPLVTRTFVPTAEVVLEVRGGRHRVPAGVPLRFRGDDTVSLVELSEPCFAVNLMAQDVGERVADPDNREDVGSRADAGTGGPAAALSPIDLGLEPPHRGQRLVVTTHSDATISRFSLLRLDGREELADHLGGLWLG